MRVDAKTRLYPKATRAMTEPTVRPETRICTRSVINYRVSQIRERDEPSMDLALLRESPVGVLGALRPPALGEHGLHDVGLRSLVSFERGTHQLRGTCRVAGELGGPLVAELIGRRRVRRPRLPLEGHDDHVVGGLGQVPVLGEAVRARGETQRTGGL